MNKISGGTSIVTALILKMAGKKSMASGIYLMKKAGCFMTGNIKIITGII